MFPPFIWTSEVEFILIRQQVINKHRAHSNLSFFYPPTHARTSHSLTTVKKPILTFKKILKIMEGLFHFEFYIACETWCCDLTKRHSQDILDLWKSWISSILYSSLRHKQKIFMYITYLDQEREDRHWIIEPLYIFESYIHSAAMSCDAKNVLYPTYLMIRSG
jgi:hypothetical protein